MAAAKPRIRERYSDSVPFFEQPARPPVDAPNVVVVVLDDLGFADLGCFGSEIETPNIDTLAAGGLRYNGFHVTALCSPTRAALLTGRNHHAVGMGHLANFPLGYPGYSGRIPKNAGTVARYLRDAGYSTFAVGKWHLTPENDSTPSGPFRLWPLGLGFERFYGFLGAETNQWAPQLVRDNSYLDRRIDDGHYHLTEDLADQAIRQVKDQQAATRGKPFFLYFAPGAVHAPHHVPRSFIERYDGRFSDGWEEARERAFSRQLDLEVIPRTASLTERPAWITPWADLPADQQRLFSRQMQVYAAFLTHTDAQVGRILEFLSAIEAIDNTVVIVLSDNGASAEGGPIGSAVRWDADGLEDVLERVDDLGSPRSYNHYSWGWAWASNTPFKLWKRYAWLGGVRVPLIVSWPDGIPRSEVGQVRGQFCHAVDLAPTILDAAEVPPPAVLDGVVQRPLDGVSLRPTFEAPDAPSPRDTQYFEMLGSRAIYHDGWKATTNHITPWKTERDLLEGSHDLATDRWSLFDLGTDFSEAHDLAGELPRKVRELSDLWWLEAGRNEVLPMLDVPSLLRVAASEPTPYDVSRRVHLAPGEVIPITSAPLDAGFRLTGGLELDPGRPADGIVCAQGDWLRGWACYFLEGHIIVAFVSGNHVSRFQSAERVDIGTHDLAVSFHALRPDASLKVEVDGRTLIDERFERATSHGLLARTVPLYVGRHEGLPVTSDYRSPFPFTGVIRELVLEMVEPDADDPDEAIRQALHTD